MLRPINFYVTPWGIPFARTSAYFCLTFDRSGFLYTDKRSQPTIYFLQKSLRMQGAHKILTGTFEFSKVFFPEEGFLLSRQISS